MSKWARANQGSSNLRWTCSPQAPEKGSFTPISIKASILRLRNPFLFISVARYLRLNVEEVPGAGIDSSNERLCTFSSFPPPKTKEDAIQMLGDQSAKNHTVFRENGGDEFIKTVAVGQSNEKHFVNWVVVGYVSKNTSCVYFVAGIFDCKSLTWTIYADNPKTSAPLIRIPLDLD